MPSKVLITKLEENRARAQELQALLDDANCPQAIIDEAIALAEEHERLKRQLNLSDSLNDISTTWGQSTEPPPPSKTVSATLIDKPKRTHEFVNIGDLASAVAKHQIGMSTDPRLASYLNQAQAVRSGEEGGVLVPADISPDIKIIHEGEMSLISLTDFTPTESNFVMVPVEEGVPHDFSGGIRAYWTAELATATKTRATTTPRAMTLDSCIALVDASNESLDDAPALENMFSIKMPQAIVARTNQALMRGTGVGTPIGVINAPARVTVAKETSQLAGTFLFENASKMFARLDPSLISTARWMIAPQIWPQLLGMTVAVKNVAGAENVGGAPVFVPGGNVAGAPFGTLFGVPVMPSEWCHPPGTEGDVVLVGWGMYHTRAKTAAPTPESAQIQMSMHILFDQNASQFRLVYRVLGFPWWSKPKPSADAGNPALSMIVTLADRA
jgi:HK97 family phage major capsid protein